MSWWHEFASRLEFDAPVGRLTWFRLGGRARYLFRPHDVGDLISLLQRASDEELPVRVLGGGSNVLVSDDGVDGLVVRLDSAPFRITKRHSAGAQGTTVTVEVGAGVDLMRLAKDFSRKGLSGLEGLAGIPGTVGGAVRMNAGGRFGSFGDCVREVRLISRNGRLEQCAARDVGFAYRHTDLGDRIVLSAMLELTPDDPARTTNAFEECLKYKRSTQPLNEHSAGCVFKNPQGHSAGALIDRAGLKGLNCGQAQVSPRHANFIVAHSGATASDVLRLVDIIRDRVRSVFGIDLETEIDIWRPTRTARGRR